LTNNKSITDQTRLAFDFLQKLYLEVSYLIKEMEGLLYEEPEKFIIGRPAGYGISTRSSTALESINVNLWLVRKLAVFFVPEQVTELKGGQTITNFSDDLKVLYMRVVLDDTSRAEPLVHTGVLYDIRKNSAAGKGPTKFEQIMAHLEYQEKKAFADPENLNYTDPLVSLRGKLIPKALYGINDSEAIVKKIIVPALELYRSN
jgi:hypothetical protein